MAWFARARPCGGALARIAAGLVFQGIVRQHACAGDAPCARDGVR
ncbi:Hypothetical protein A7982_01614 [Minicystis rosea]|nr:Hypothetical protein A7982_01614 [Minicystis rosea]